MKLYLVQHAEAKLKEEDPERSLTEKGLTDIRRVAAFVADLKDMQVSSIFHSGKTRAVQTAAVLNENLKPSQGINIADDLEPLADLSGWIERLARERENIMIVGHLPHLSKLAGKLLCDDENRQVIAFQMAGVVCLTKDELGTWSLQWMVTPDILKG